MALLAHCSNIRPRDSDMRGRVVRRVYLTTPSVAYPTNGLLQKVSEWCRCCSSRTLPVSQFLTSRGVHWMYIGPDALMPLASAFAAVAGFVLMFWRRIVGAVRYLFGRGEPKGEVVAVVEEQDAFKR